MNNTEKLKGIGGWLGLYIFFGFMSVLSLPVVIFVPTAVIIPNAILTIGNAIACYLLLKKNSNAVKFVRIVLLARMSLSAIHSLFYLANFMRTLFSGGNYYELILNIAITSGSVFSAWIWFMYFRKSVRVKLTFPEALSPEPSNQSMRLWNWVGGIVILIYLPFSVYAQVLKIQIKPIMRESIGENGKMVLSDILKNPRKGTALQKEALQKLWESKH